MAFESVSVFSYATPHHNLTSKEWKDSVPYRNIIDFVNMSRTVEEIREKGSAGQLHHLLTNCNRFFSGELSFSNTGTIGCDGCFVVVIKCILVVLVEDKFFCFITGILSFPIFLTFPSGLNPRCRLPGLGSRPPML